MNAVALGTSCQTFILEYSDNALVQSLINGNEQAFEQVFKAYFKNLHAYACNILKNDATSEEVVQNVFFKLWNSKSNINVQSSLSAYLYRAVHNECMNHIKHGNVRKVYQLHAAHTMQSAGNGHADHSHARAELQQKLQEALNDLPEQCRTVFQLSRFEELKYREIAKVLGISVKTVENQMGKALRILRTKLADFLPLLIFIHCLF
ncbi:RNA polymerase sigma-70 factor [Danxiaibacter flavus]|uniref:RNA polymerase sigma-70 factor n=1 Tax=Danxiaibacter flavus TaxID=3049108 RepID=A0ABV3ZLN6_9BACT|nr:RNA polymerase sigma-70 factor [Chitinophagaceae bacterium DXS]